MPAMELDLIPTVAVLAAALGALGVAIWRQRRTRPGHPPMVPWGGIQFLAVLSAVLMVAHLVSLLSGTPLAGRLGTW